jgi:large subunit ribosomal protein L4
MGIRRKTETLNPEQPPVVIKLPILRMDGSPTGEEVELNPRLFGLPRNDHVLYLAVKTELTNQRHGTHATQNRALVVGGGRKPFKQKGRGGARAGTIRSPLWRGGGKIFGPQPHAYEMKLPVKVKRLARRVAFSLKAQSGAISLLEDFDLAAPKTQKIAGMLKALDALNQSVLLLVAGHKPVIVKSCANIQRLEVREGMTASTYDIMRAKKVLISRSALASLEGGLVVG